MDSVRFSQSVEILVTDHAYWQAALRCRGYFTERIDGEVRDALAAGRVSRAMVGAGRRSDPTCLYVWTEEVDRVFALRHDLQPPRFVVTTVMTPPYDLDSLRARRRAAVLLESRRHEPPQEGFRPKGAR